MASALAACSKPDCSGILVDGACQPVCLENECGPKERCVENRCSPECQADDDCSDGVCRSVTADYGGRGDYCLYHQAASNPPAEDVETDAEAAADRPPTATIKSCSSNDECADPTTQTHCVDGACVVACRVHSHCVGVGACTGEAVDTDGAAVTFCETDAFPREPGQHGWHCVNGNDDCDRDAGFRCLSRGEGDIDGYCGSLGCADDLECPAGYYCNSDRFMSLAPCEAACGLTPAPNNPECIPAADIGDGKSFRCIPDGLELRSCRRRAFCSSCETDADCRSVKNQVCADDGTGQKICTVLCEPNSSSCPWGSATSCAVHDSDLGVPTCAHKAGSCRTDGASCTPCLDDADCPGGFCSGSSFTGERFCLNLEDRCQCAPGEDFCFGGGCPETPGGLVMNCVPAGQGATPSVCFGASIVPGDVSGQLGCWPPGAAPP